MAVSAEPKVTIGIVANPVSARDIRRVVANASNLQTSDRVNMLLRLLASAAAGGVTQALVMPDRAGQRALLQRALQRAEASAEASAEATRFPRVDFLDFEPDSNVHDTFRATRELVAAGVAAIVVLGGDGTHRAVVRQLRELGAEQIPLVALSTGTNNAFPEMRESAVAGLALGLYASGRLHATHALRSHKLIEVTLRRADGSVQHDIAIVDAVVSSERFLGARAIWKTASIRSVFLAFADPECIGLSAIGGLLQPVPRDATHGLAVHLAGDGQSVRTRLRAPIAPGLVAELPVADWHPLEPMAALTLPRSGGTIALDGERELEFGETDCVSVALRDRAFFTVDIARSMRHAARLELMRAPP